jgi:hypothetical protein
MEEVIMNTWIIDSRVKKMEWDKALQCMEIRANRKKKQGFGKKQSV